MVGHVGPVGQAAQQPGDAGSARIVALDVGVLDDDQPTRTQQASGLGDQSADDVKPVRAAVKRERGVVVAHFRVPWDRVVGHVGRIRHDDIDQAL